MDGGQFYVPSSGPLNQGDVLIAPVARVSSPGFFVPDRWDALDQDEHHVVRSGTEGDIYLLSGRALVMVTSHDCHHDKEWNTARSRLLRAGHSVEEVEAIAESDETLDRTFHASPLVPLDDFGPSDRGNYRSGRVVGFFPVPASPDGAYPESVVDLTYRSTIDKHAITNRRWCLSAEPRNQLRYAIARFDSFRTVEVSEKIEQAVGKSITEVSVESAGGLAVILTLDDGSSLRLVQPPAEPEPAGRTRI